ncbi:MAG: hypothetical protein IAI50_06425, partial [Candidatus Eremiobacteraeota bacterium]|nr:hypothetical protein [Candidatus Eremiobacteraeota bacterium]
PSLVLLPEVEARAVLSGRTLRFRLLRPPFAAIGTGALRVLRVVERAGDTEIVAGYDGYDRIDMRERTAAER